MELLLGFLISLAIGLTGVGGGVLTAPLLILFLGMPAGRAVGTALAFVAVVKSVAVAAYIARGQVSWRTLKPMLAGGVPAVIAGVLLLAGSRNALVLGVVGATVIVSASLSLLRSLLRVERQSRERSALLAAAGGAIGFEVGFSSAGAGALGTLALLQFSALSPAEVVGTDLLFGFVISAIGGGMHLASGSFDPAVLARLIAGGVAGAVAGAWLAGAVPSRALRIGIYLLLVGLGCRLCFDALVR